MVDKYTSDLLITATQSVGAGSLETSIGSAFFGLDHEGIGNPVPTNSELYGMTFFTRPRLNLTYDNIKLVRMLTPMLINEQMSIPRAVRAYLDPVGSKEIYKSGLVDPLNAFIPILSNTLESLTGWPDPYLDVYTTRAGMYREQFSMSDGFTTMYEAYSLNASFKNIINDPISMLFQYWTTYAQLVREGEINPYPSSILENEIDYNTRIYRLILDPSRRFVMRIGACGAAFPKSVNLGSAYNYNANNPYNLDLNNVSTEFQIMGAMYQDPILVYEFNEVVNIFNPNMRDGEREKYMVKLDLRQRRVFNFQGYPRINRKTMELEWYVFRQTYLNTINRVRQLDPTYTILT